MDMETSKRGSAIVGGFVALCAALLLLTYAFTAAVAGGDALAAIVTLVLGVILLIVFFGLYARTRSLPSS